MPTTAHSPFWPRKGSSNVDQQGIEWRTPRWGRRKPYWTIEPDVSKMENLARNVFGLDSSQKCKVSFMAGGSYNKLYNITTSQHERPDSVFRVIPPVDPINKTETEVATLKFLETKTSIPAPKVIAYGIDCRDIGFEWILMTKLPGKPLAEVERWMSLEQKIKLVKQLAPHLVELFKLRFDMIGSLSIKDMTRLHCRPASPSRPSHGQVFEVKHVVSQAFFYDNHINLRFDRGPYRTSKKWLEERMRLFIYDQEQIINRLESKQEVTPKGESELVADEAQHGSEQMQCTRDDQNVTLTANPSPDGDGPEPENPVSVSEKDRGADTEDNTSDTESVDSDEEELAEARFVDNLARIIFGEIIEEAFGQDSEQQDETPTIYHQDLHEGNVLVDDDGNLTGLVDWECISAVPLWEACQLPLLLESREREQCPDRDDYPDYDPATWGGTGPDPEAEINGNKNVISWEHRSAHHCTLLRQVFLQEMGHICPEWVAIHKRSTLRRSLSLAVSAIASELLAIHVDQWMRHVRKGDFEDDLNRRIWGDDWTLIDLTVSELRKAEAMWVMYRLSQKISEGEIEWNPAMMPLLEGSSNVGREVIDN